MTLLPLWVALVALSMLILPVQDGHDLLLRVTLAALWTLAEAADLML